MYMGVPDELTRKYVQLDDMTNNFRFKLIRGREYAERV